MNLSSSATSQRADQWKCSEAIFISKTEEHITQHSDHFEEMWNKSQPVDLLALQAREAGRSQPFARASALQMCNRRAPAREQAERMEQLQGGRLPPPGAEPDVRARARAIMAGPGRH